MGHIQGPTPIQFGKIAVNGIITDTVLQRRSKSMDICCYWICGWCWQNKSMFIGSNEDTIFPTIQQDIILHNITFKFHQPMYSIPIKNKQKLYLNYQNDQWHFKGVFKHIFHKHLNNGWFKSLNFRQCLLHQCWTNFIIYTSNFDLS